jgi:hypothetical protein
MLCVVWYAIVPTNVCRCTLRPLTACTVVAVVIVVVAVATPLTVVVMRSFESFTSPTFSSKSTYDTANQHVAQHIV